MKILLTGAAGFIGVAAALRLLARRDDVVGLDSFNDYYDVSLKESRLKRYLPLPGFRFVKDDRAGPGSVAILLAAVRFDRVIHLAAQAWVRYSIRNPLAYADSNLTGFVNALKNCRHDEVQHLLYASSASIYGGNTKIPFKEHDSVDHPVSLCAVSKKVTN